MSSYRAFTGDDKGQIKSVTCEIPGPGSQEQARISATIIQTPDQPREPIHKLKCFKQPDSESGILAAAYAGGQITQYSYASGSDELQEQCSWKEKRMNGSDRFVGLQILPGKGWLTCTQHGRLRLSKSLGESSTSSPEESIASLPMRLNDMRLDSACTTLAYGGDEVDLSLWDVERTFSEKPAPSSEDTAGKKRKKGKGDLLYAEIWRAKQLPNDSLSLRQPVHITSLAFLRGSQNPGPTVHIATGNKSGAVRRFDTRAARRPVANWENIAKIGGIQTVEVGQNEHELFVSDNGSNLCALDLRNGKICYSYKGLPSAPTSFSPISQTHLASVSLDRVFRLHTVHPPPAEPNSQQPNKGQVVGQEFLKSTPIVVAWDQFEIEPAAAESDEEEDVWEGMEVWDDDSGDESSDSEDRSTKKKRARK